MHLNRQLVYYHSPVFFEVFSINRRSSKDKGRSKGAASRDWMMANCKGVVVEVEDLRVG